MPFSSVTLPNDTERQLGTYLRETSLKGGVFLFHGSSDHNRVETMKLFAKYFLCTGTRDGSCPCPSCRLSIGEHPDIAEMSLSGAGNILVQTVKDSVEFLEEYSTVSDRRCLIIEHADKLTEYAEDSLLKILEQDPDGILVLIACRNKKNISQTIMSRAKPFFTGDASRGTYFPILSKKGIRVKKAEEYARLSEFISVDPFLAKDLIDEAHKEVPYLVSYIMAGETLKAIRNFNKFARDKSLKGLRLYAEVVVATINDFLKVKFSASSEITLVSRTKWYLEKIDNMDEGHLNMVFNAFRRVVKAEERQVKPLFVWAIGITSTLVHDAKQKEVV